MAKLIKTFIFQEEDDDDPEEDDGDDEDEYDKKSHIHYRDELAKKRDSVANLGTKLTLNGPAVQENNKDNFDEAPQPHEELMDTKKSFVPTVPGIIYQIDVDKR